jgi:hypothetical protein
MHTQAEWEALFANNAENIIKAHIGTKAEAEFSSEGFKAKAQDLRDFLFMYGNDSGNVPSCG